MKNLILAGLCLLAAAAQATITITNTLNPTTISGTPSVPGTNYSTPVVVGYVTFRFNPNFIINQGGLNSTNSALFLTKISTDTNTLYGQCISTNTFPSTNAGALSVLPGNATSIPIYGWQETIVTNNTTVWHQVITGTP